MIFKHSFILALLAFRGPIVAAISENEECRCTKTVYVTKTATEISGESSSIEAPSAIPSSSTTTGYLTFTVTSTETVIVTLSRTTTTLTLSAEPITATLPPSEPSDTSIPTGYQTDASDIQPATPFSSINSITTMLTSSPKPPYENHTISRTSGRCKHTIVSTGISSPTSYTESGIYTPNITSSQLSTTETGYTLSTLQTSVTNSDGGVASSTGNPELSSSYILSTTQLPYLSRIPSSATSSPSSSSVWGNSGATITTETPSDPSSSSIATITRKQPYGYYPPNYIQKRHRGGYENAREGEGPWPNA